MPHSRLRELYTESELDTVRRGTVTLELPRIFFFNLVLEGEGMHEWNKGPIMNNHMITCRGEWGHALPRIPRYYNNMYIYIQVFLLIINSHCHDLRLGYLILYNISSVDIDYGCYIALLPFEPSVGECEESVRREGGVGGGGGGGRERQQNYFFVQEQAPPT